MTLDLFHEPPPPPPPEPAWLEVRFQSPGLERVDTYRVRELLQPIRHVEVQRRLRPGEAADPGGSGWARICWHKRVREIAELAGLEP